jgi:hypothetical protein
VLWQQVLPQVILPQVALHRQSLTSEQALPLEQQHWPEQTPQCLLAQTRLLDGSKTPTALCHMLDHLLMLQTFLS